MVIGDLLVDWMQELKPLRRSREATSPGAVLLSAMARTSPKLASLAPIAPGNVPPDPWLGAGLGTLRDGRPPSGTGLPVDSVQRETERGNRFGDEGHSPRLALVFGHVNVVSEAEGDAAPGGVEVAGVDVAVEPLG